MKKKYSATLLILLFCLGLGCSGNGDSAISAVTPITQAEIVTTRVIEETEVDVIVTPVIEEVFAKTAVVDSIETPMESGDVLTATRAIEEEAVVPTHVAPVELDVPIMSVLPRGQSRNNAYAEDVKMRPDPEFIIEITEEEPLSLTFDQFYKEDAQSSYLGLEMTDYLQSLDGKQVVIEGYMAPPLKLGLDWYMLNRIPQASCSFCSGASDWVDDAILVYYHGEEFPYTYNPMRITGELHTGPVVDTQTGMVSFVRIYPNVKDMVEISYER